MAKRPHFRIAGIPVRVELYFFVIIGILAYEFNLATPQLSYILAFIGIAFVSVLVHELGHAVAFRAYGVDPHITLMGMGGVTTGQGRLTPGQQIVVSLAGPLSVLVLFGIPSIWLYRAGTVTSTDGRQFLLEAMWVIVGWSVLNLLPLLPLDGGNVVMCLFDAATKGRGRRPAEILSIGVAVVGGLLAWGSYPGLTLMALFIVGINVSSLTRAKQQELGDEMSFGYRALMQHKPAEAEQVAAAVLANRPSGPSLRQAAELMAWARLWQGDQAGAEEVLARFAHAGAPSTAFRSAQALAAGRLVEGVSLLAWSLTNEPASASQALGVVAVAGTGQVRPLVGDLLRVDGGAGVKAAMAMRSVLEFTGYQREAEAVTALLSADGRAGPLATA